MNLTYQTNPDMAVLGAQSNLVIVLAASSIFLGGGGSKALSITVGGSWRNLLKISQNWSKRGLIISFRTGSTGVLLS